MTTIAGDLAKASRRTSGIGSLPHHNIDAALDLSFRCGIPFLPQIPIRNPWELMIPQALEGFPGLEVNKDGTVELNIDVWASRAKAHREKLERALSAPPSTLQAFEEFEPSPAVSSSWQPFVWELGERSYREAKIQIAGPLTCQWSLKLKNGARANEDIELSAQIYRHVWARAVAMIRRLRGAGIKPILFIDEPGLYLLSQPLTALNPHALSGLRELALMIRALKNEGASVGLHCCSNTRWESVLDLGMDHLSIDLSLSLDHLLVSATDALVKFIREGGSLSLGVIPTSRSSVIRSLDLKELHGEMQETLSRGLADRPELIRGIFERAIFTPACGLALHSTEDVEQVFDALEEFHDLCRSSTEGLLNTT